MKLRDLFAGPVPCGFPDVTPEEQKWVDEFERKHTLVTRHNGVWLDHPMTQAELDTV